MTNTRVGSTKRTIPLSQRQCGGGVSYSTTRQYIRRGEGRELTPSPYCHQQAIRASLLRTPESVDRAWQAKKTVTSVGSNCPNTTLGMGSDE